MSDVGDWERRDTVGCQPSNHSLIRPEQAGASAENTNLSIIIPHNAAHQWALTEHTVNENYSIHETMSIKHQAHQAVASIVHQ